MRIAELEDLPDALSMGLKFINQTDYKDIYSEGAIKTVMEEILLSPKTDKIMLIEPGKAFLMGMAVPFVYGDFRMASELAWWVEPEFRKTGLGSQLLMAFEYWAKNIANCKTISMACLDDKTGEFYVKEGYKLYERAYMKVL